MKILICFCLCVFVAACAPVSALPIPSTPSILPTQTASPAPTNTMKPTLEPWMQSLPEGVVTIEKDANKIIGLDADGKPVMEFDSETGEWIKLAPVIDQATWEKMKPDEQNKYVLKHKQQFPVEISGGKLVEGQIAKSQVPKYGCQSKQKTSQTF